MTATIRPANPAIGPSASGRTSADALAFTPFYERLAGRTPIVGKLLFASGVGTAFILIRVLVDGQRAIADWSPLLGVLITAALLALYVATYTFRVLLADVASRAGVTASDDLVARAQTALADRRLVAAGLAFAVLNCLVALTLGIPAGSLLSRTTLVAGYALAGFVCGVAAYCIIGVYLVLQHLPAHLARERALDYTSPDGCGGTSFIGEALVVFAVVTMLVGVLISIYIANAPWQIGAESRAAWVDLVVRFWIAFPYIMSFAALVLPALSVRDALREYKRQVDAALRAQMRMLEQRLDDMTDALKQREELLRARRLELHRMRLWPFDVKSYVTYGAVLMPHLGVSAKTAATWFSKSVAG